MKQSLRVLFTVVMMLCMHVHATTDVNFRMPPANAVIKSQANARGVDNVDCCVSDADDVAEITSKLCVIDVETEIIRDITIDTESKVCVVDSALDNATATVDLADEFGGTYTALEELISKICIVEDNTQIIDNTSDALLSKACIIESTLDSLDVSTDVLDEFNGTYTMLEHIISKLCVVDEKTDDILIASEDTESKLCVVESALEALDVSNDLSDEFGGTYTLIAFGTSKACVVEDTIDAIDQEQESLLSKACVVESVFDAFDVSFNLSDEFSTVEELVDEVTSKVCVVENQVTTEIPVLNEIESKADIITSLIDVNVSGDFTDEFGTTFTLIETAFSKACVVEDKVIDLDSQTKDVESALCAVESRLDSQDATVDLSEEFGGTYTALEEAISKACVVDEKVTIVDETSVENESKACVIESKLDALDVSDTVADEFGGTYTLLDATLSKACIIEDQVDVVTSQIEDIRTVDFGGTFTEIDSIESKLCAFDSKLDYLFETRLDLLTTFFMELDQLSIDIMEAMSVIDILSDKVLISLSDIDEMLENVEDKLCDATSKACTIESKVDDIQIDLDDIHTQDFGGTFTLADELLSKVCAIDMGITVVNGVVNNSLSKACVLESVIDDLAQNTLDFTQEFNNTYTLLEASISKLCVIEDKTINLQDALYDVESKACAFESGLDVLDVSMDLSDEFGGTFTLIEELLSKVCVLEQEADDLSIVSASVESKACVIDSKLDYLVEVGASIEQTFIDTFTVLEAAISKACVLEILVAESDDATNLVLSKACVVDSKVDAIDLSNNLADEFGDTFTALAELESKVCVIEDNTLTFDDIIQETYSKLCVIESKVDALDVSSTTTDEFNSIYSSLEDLKSKICLIEDNVDILDGDATDLFNKVCLLEDLVDMIDVSDDLSYEFSLVQSALDQLQTKVCAGLCQPTLITTAPYTITASGTYLVANDLSIAGTENVISIDADDVVLNICGYTLSRSSEGTIILIRDNHYNIEIFNGMMKGASGKFTRGILMLSGLESINIHDITIQATRFDITVNFAAIDPIRNLILKNMNLVDNEGYNVFFFNTTPGNIAVSNLIIENVVCNGSSIGGSFELGDIENAYISNCSFINSINQYAINIFESTNIHVDKIIIANNKRINGGAYSGIVCSSSTKCHFEHIDILNNVSSSSMKVMTLSNECTVSDIRIDGNESINGLCTGINLGLGSECCVSQALIRNNRANTNFRGIVVENSGNVIEKCQVINNQSSISDLIAFYIESASVNNMLVDCVANNNSSVYADAHGFGLVGITSENVFIRCIALCNQSSGFIAPSGSTCTNTEFTECQAMYNGVSGFNLIGADNTVSLFKNIACGNGSY